MIYRILTLNDISPRGLARLPRERYEVGAAVTRPDAILVRSADLHGFEVAPGVRAIGRAGAGVNNIPVADMSRRGIPVFNTPGANANAVKELVLAGLLLAARNIGPAWLVARPTAGGGEGTGGAGATGQKDITGVPLPRRRPKACRRVRRASPRARGSAGDGDPAAPLGRRRRGRIKVGRQGRGPGTRFPEDPQRPQQRQLPRGGAAAGAEHHALERRQPK